MAPNCREATKGPQGPQTETGSHVKMHSIILSFEDPRTEAQYLAEVAAWRWPVLLIIFAFDVLIWAIRAGFQMLFAAPKFGTCDASEAECLEAEPEWRQLSMSAAQVGNLCVLHGLLWAMNFRSRRSGDKAARQEECLLALLIALAVSNLIFCLTPENASDYIYGMFFLICAASYVKVRWWIAMLVMMLPTCTAMVKSEHVLPPTSKQHIVVAWLVGSLMAWLAESYRRCTFANQQVARLAHAKELQEKSNHLEAQEKFVKELSTVREEAAQRALVVMREKAANEAKSEFMSLMCHEVRTPLNGCLASAEMLLDTPLLDEQRELTNTIRISGSILLSTVSNFLDFFKVQAGKKLDIVRTPFDLTDLVSDAHAIVDAMMGQNKKVKLLPPQSDMELSCLMGDPDRLKGVLLNLFSNAAKFTPSGFICVRLRKCMAQEVASGTHINAERSYTMCLQALQKANQKDPPLDRRNVASMENAASGKGGLGRKGSRHRSAGLTWWEEWLENGQEPDWDSWQACTPRTNPRVDLGSNSQGDSEDAPAAATLTEIRTAARTTKSDPGRRKRLHPGRRDASKATGSTPTPESRQSTATRLSDMDSRPSATASRTSARASQDAGAWTLPVAADGDSAAPEGQRRSDGASSTRAAGRPNSRSALDLPGQVIVVEVVDTGHGVPAEARKSLFSKFVQGSEKQMEKARAVSGTGLGLSICAKQMNVLGGTIGATSSPGCGSIFWFCFPIEEAPSSSEVCQTLPHSSSWHPTPNCTSPPAQPLSTPSQILPSPGGSSSSHTGSSARPVAVSAAAASTGAVAGSSTGSADSTSLHNRTGSAAVPVPSPSHSHHRHSPHSNFNASSLPPCSSSPATRSSTGMRYSTSTQHTTVSSGSYSSMNDPYNNRHAFSPHAPMSYDDPGARYVHMPPQDPSGHPHHAYHAQHTLNVLQEHPSAPGSSSSPSPQYSKIPDVSTEGLNGIFPLQDTGAVSQDDPQVVQQVRAPLGTAPLFLSLASDSLLYKPPKNSAPGAGAAASHRAQSFGGPGLASRDSSKSDSSLNHLRSALSVGDRPVRHTVNASDTSSQGGYVTGNPHPSDAPPGVVKPLSGLSMEMPQRQRSPAEHNNSVPHVRSSHSSFTDLQDPASSPPHIPGVPGYPMAELPPEYLALGWAAQSAWLQGLQAHTVPVPVPVAVPTMAPHYRVRYPTAPGMHGAHMMMPWQAMHPDMAAIASQQSLAAAAAAAAAAGAPLTSSPNSQQPPMQQPPQYSPTGAMLPPQQPPCPNQSFPTPYTTPNGDTFHWNPLQNPCTSPVMTQVHAAAMPYPAYPGHVSPPPPGNVSVSQPISQAQQVQHAHSSHTAPHSPALSTHSAPNDPNTCTDEQNRSLDASVASQPMMHAAHAHSTSHAAAPPQPSPAHPEAQKPRNAPKPRPSVDVASSAGSPPRAKSARSKQLSPPQRDPATSAAPQGLPTVRPSSDFSAQDSQVESLPGSSICESLDAWGQAGSSGKPPLHKNSLDEAYAHSVSHLHGSSMHRGSLDSVLASARPWKWQMSQKRPVHMGMNCTLEEHPGNATSQEEADGSESPKSVARSTQPMYSAGAVPTTTVAGSDLEPSALPPTSTATTAHMHTTTQLSNESLHGTFQPTHTNNHQHVFNSTDHSLQYEAAATSESMRAPQHASGAPQPHHMSATPVATAATAAASAPTGSTAVPAEQAHVQLGSSDHVSRVSSTAGSLDAQQQHHRESSLDVTNGICVMHNSSEGGSRSVASLRSFGDDEAGSGGGDFGIDGVRVLVAEDNLINQMVAKKMLAALGATVSVVSNGQEAVNIVCASQRDASDDTAFDASQTDSSQAHDTDSNSDCAFDVVLMDMAMPQMDGLQATLELRRRGCKIPIVAMTANVSDGDRASCHDSGMDGFLSKPILKGRLGRAIRQVIASGTLFPPNMLTSSDPPKDPTPDPPSNPPSAADDTTAAAAAATSCPTDN